MTHAARTLAALVLCAMLAACASGPRATEPDTQTQNQTVTQPDETELAAMQADGVGGATAVAVPVARWLGSVILQMFQNVKLNVDVKLDNPQKATP
jgi:starvation-inducible outer membrane lipoprotein